MEEQLRKLVDRYRGCEQRPVRFRPKTWRARLEAHDAAHVLDVGVACTTGTSGDRLIDRGDLARLRDAVNDDPGSLRDLFVAVMIWGSGTTNGRGPRYTDAALSDGRLPDVLRSTREAVREGDLSEAYRRFGLKGVGRSFFTKWFAAVDDRDGGERALILDNRVIRSLNALGWTSWQAAGTRRLPLRYAAYVSAMHGWAPSLGVSPERLEWVLFEVNGHIDEACSRTP
ncbi:8-oxoguanine DNA glycosylase OGG fold protein [Streptomyces sp. GESEQ-13]|uniref:8-oxoguanine DNA glycosylase OGG fold protein n=1 Tax=Streptomyces sp. GESEQ-13 TaxID=2812654 RepID=UPI001B3234DF